VLPKDDSRRLSALQEAALGPDIYKDLYSAYTETGLPSDETLRAELVAFKGFNPNAVDDFVRDFRATLDFAFLEDSDGVDLGVESNESSTTPSKAESSALAARSLSDSTGTLSSTKVPIKSYSWGLSPETTAELRLIGQVSTEDLEMLRDYVEITIKALGRSTRREDQK